MRIAQVAPLAESVPPRLYGGTERVVSLLTERLVARGHEVTLFASGDSVTSASLAPSVPQALRGSGSGLEHLPAMLWQLAEVGRRAGEFDIIHSHVDWPGLAFSQTWATPTVTTTHGRLDLTGDRVAFELFSDSPLVSISNAQRNPLPKADWLRTVYNGIDVDYYHFRDKPGDYLVFLGRISPDKGPDRAIAIARETGMRLVMAAKVDSTDVEYYETLIKPLIDRTPRVEFIGEVDDSEKDELLGGAYAYLFPISWPEPFGLTMVEAMATGTPVIAARQGSVVEVVENGVTGFIGDDLNSLIAAVENVPSLDRMKCRQRVEDFFSAERMVTDYELAYQELAKKSAGRKAEVGVS